MASFNHEKKPTGPHTVPNHLLPQNLSDEECLAYAKAHRSSARSIRLKALLGLAFGLVVLWLAGRRLAADFGYGQQAHPVDEPASSTPERRALPIVLQPKIQSPTNKNGAGVCTTPACTEFARVIKDNLAKNYSDIDPCTNFADYVCGGWQENHTYRPDQSSVNSFSVLADENNDILRSILQHGYPKNSSYSGADETANRKNFAKMKTTFNACMDEKAIKKQGVKPLKDLLDDLPGAEATFGNSGSMTDSLIWLARHGVDALIGTGTTPDDRKPEVVTIILAGGSYGLPSKEYYDKPDILANYSKTIQEMFGIVNDVEGYLYKDFAEGVVDFESRIAKAQPDRDQENDVTYYYNPKPFSEVDDLVSQISIKQFLQAFIPAGYKPDQVIVYTPDYFPQLSKILENTPMEVVKGYFQWQLINQWSDRLHRDYTRPIRVFKNQLNGRPDDAVPERWRTCLGEVDSNMEWIESSFYVQAEFGAEDKKFGEKIIDDIRAIYTERLDTYEWMADAVKTKAKQKVANIVKKIGYPDASPNVLDPIAVRNYYANVSVSKSNFFKNGLTFAAFTLNSSWTDLLHPTDKKKWGMTAPTVNAYYNPSTNEIAFPAGIMKDPFFNAAVPKYISYGSFGVVSGHELTHGFDNSGSQYDENGAYKQWWDAATRAAFTNRTHCFSDQYSQFTVPGLGANETLHVNGKLTLGENIADAGGLSAAHAAWVKRNKEEPDALLPGLPEELDQERLFFVSFATAWCGNIRREAAVERIYTDPHSPGRYRTIGTVANSRAFREAWDCPVKEPTCDLW